MIYQKCYMNVNYCNYNDNNYNYNNKYYYYYLIFCNEFYAGFSPGTRYGCLCSVKLRTTFSRIPFLECSHLGWPKEGPLLDLEGRSWVIIIIRRFSSRLDVVKDRDEMFHFVSCLFFLLFPTQSSHLFWLLTSLTNSSPNPTTETSWDPQVNSYSETVWISPIALSISHFNGWTCWPSQSEGILMPP